MDERDKGETAQDRKITPLSTENPDHSSPVGAQNMDGTIINLYPFLYGKRQCETTGKLLGDSWLDNLT